MAPHFHADGTLHTHRRWRSTHSRWRQRGLSDEQMNATRLVVDVVDGRHRVRMRHGLLRAQRLHGPPDRARVALVGQTALLLGGDEVELQIDVGPGAVLELSRGGRHQWRTTVAAGPRAGRPGSPWTAARNSSGPASRSWSRTVLTSPAARASIFRDGARATLRETVVLGRSGELGGALRSRVRVQREDRPVLLEDLLLDPGDRHGPGPARRPPCRRLTSRLAVARPPDVGGGAVRFELVEPDCTLTRYLGSELAESPLVRRPSELCR